MMTDLDLIFTCLQKHSDKPDKDISLFQGLSCDLLLLYSLVKSTGEERFKQLIKKNFETIQSYLNDIKTLDFHNGLSGIIFSLSEISEYLDIKIPDIELMRALFLKFAEKRFRNGDYDLQTGLIGIGLIFLSLHDSESVLFICSLLIELMSTYEGYVILPYKKESHPFFPSGTEWVNNGFLHGINSVQAFLLICIKEGVYNERITKIVNLITDNTLEITEKNNGSSPMAYMYSPKTGLLWDKRPTKLYYCTGEFGIINNLITYAELFGSLSCIDAAKNIFTRIVNRIYDGERNENACFCHGKATLLYFLKKFRFLLNEIPLQYIEIERTIRDQLIKSLKHNELNQSLLNGENGILLSLFHTHANSVERALLLH